jgi:hypothetical protein
VEGLVETVNFGLKVLGEEFISANTFLLATESWGILEDLGRFSRTFVGLKRAWMLEGFIGILELVFSV